MKYNVYSMQDILIGFFGPELCNSDELMVRNYKERCDKSDHPEDLRLFKIGEFDSETGEITGCTPNCMIGGLSHGED